MKHTSLGIGLILATSLAVGGAAVSLTAQQSTPKPMPKQATPAGTVKITGCLEREAPPATTAGTKAPAAPAYQLTHLSADDWKTAMGTSSTMLGATDLTTLKEVDVKPNSGMDLKAHVDHKVELTGKLSQSAKATADIKGPTLHVSALKMIATSCQ